MKTIHLTNQSVFLTLGLPGSGKTFFARQFAEEYNLTHLQFDRIKDILFGDVEIDGHDEQKILALMNMLLEDALKQGLSVVYDAPLNTRAQRKAVRAIGAKLKIKHLIIWVQTDLQTAYDRATRRDRRQVDDKYSVSISDETFTAKQNELKKPLHEDYVVISGKHVYRNQSRAVKKKLEALNLVGVPVAKAKTEKPSSGATTKLRTHTPRVSIGRRIVSSRRDTKRSRP